MDKKMAAKARQHGFIPTPEEYPHTSDMGSADEE